MTRLWKWAVVLAAPIVLGLGMLGMDSWGDEAFYALGGYHHFVDGHRLYSPANPMIYPPLVFTFWMPSQWIAGPSFFAMRLEAVVVGCLMLLLLYQLACRLDRPAAGLIAVSIFLTSRSAAPIFATGAPYVLTGFIIATIYWLLAGNWTSLGRFVAASLMLGILGATRHNAGVCAGVGLLVLAMQHPRRWAAAAIVVGCSALSFCAVVACFWPEVMRILPNPPWVYAPAGYGPFARPGADSREIIAVVKGFIRSHAHLFLGLGAGVTVLLWLRWRPMRLVETAASPGVEIDIAANLGRRPILVSITTTASALFLLHFVGPFAFAPSLITMYFLYCFPLFCLLLGFLWNDVHRRAATLRWAAPVAVACICSLGIMAKLPSKWVGVHGFTPLTSLQQTGKWIENRTTPNEAAFIISRARPNPLHIAHRRTFPLLENAPFSYTPDPGPQTIYGFFNATMARTWLAESSDVCLVWNDARKRWKEMIPEMTTALEQVLDEQYVLEDVLEDAWPSGRLELYRKVPAANRVAGRSTTLAK